MKKLMKKVLFSGLVTLLLTLAAAGISSACSMSLYQPREPK